MRIRPKTNDELAAQFAGTIRLADQSRTALLAEVFEEEEIKAEALGRERARLTAKYGANSPRVQDLTARIEARAALRAELKAEHQRTQITAPPASEGKAVLYGRVMDSTGAGIEGLTVTALVGECEEAGVTTRTDELGGYCLALPVTREAAVLLEVKAGAKTLHRDREPRQAVAGTVTYHEIAIDRKRGQPPGREPKGT